MDSFTNDVKDFDDDSSEEEYDVDGILPDPSYLHNNNNNNLSNNSSSPMSLHQNNNYYSHGKRDKSSSSSRENHHKRNKTHAAIVHHDDRHQQIRKVRMATKQQQQQQQQQQHFHEERSIRRKKKAATRRKVHDVVDDDDDGVFASPTFRRDELDASFPPPRLSDFDEMFHRAASNRIRRTKGHHDPGNHLDMDPGCGNPGEQYYLDLAGNIRKVKKMSLMSLGASK